jgi:hypothetical protein
MKMMGVVRSYQTCVGFAIMIPPMIVYRIVQEFGEGVQSHHFVRFVYPIQVNLIVQAIAVRMI